LQQAAFLIPLDVQVGGSNSDFVSVQ